jgi:Fe-S-cluster containining protein
MLDSYRQIIDQAKAKTTENKKFLERLRQRKPRDLDQVTNAMHEEAFEHIDCLQCANCCSTTGPLLLDKDIERLGKHFKIKPSVFTEKYLLMDEDGDYVFKSMPCPFLGEDKYCCAYESRPNACREFPHTQQRNMAQKLKITALNTLICPAVAEVVEGLKKHYH